MKRREFLTYGATLAASGAIAGCGGSDDDNVTISPPTQAPPDPAQPKVVVQWNEAALQAVRDVKPGPPMCARSLAIVHTAMFDAWAAYDSMAVGTRLQGLLRRPASERTNANKAKGNQLSSLRSIDRSVSVRKGAVRFADGNSAVYGNHQPRSRDARRRRQSGRASGDRLSAQRWR